MGRRWGIATVVCVVAVLGACASDGDGSASGAATGADAAGAATTAPANEPVSNSIVIGGNTDPSVVGTMTVEPSTTAAPTSTTGAVDTTVAVTTPTSTSTSTASNSVSSGPSDIPIEDQTVRAGAERLHFEVGPLDVKSGQNNITNVVGALPQPKVDGWIVRIAPNLRYADGSIPPVDVIHLHHGVWLSTAGQDATRPHLPERFFASGEEKTVTTIPAGYGYEYHASDTWILNYMIHDLTPTAAQVWITYDVDIIPAAAPAAQGLVAARPVWMDVENGGLYPVFDVLKGSGTGGLFTYPTDADDPYGAGKNMKNEWTIDRDGVLLTTAGHLHPGGLHNDLWVTHGTDTAHVFESDAVYYEPAGAVSWDVSMTATPPDWRVQVHAGDTLSTTATYDSARASWYESMGIMVVWMADTTAPGESAADPFTTAVDVTGVLTHGHLAENDHHGGEPDPTYQDLTALPSVAALPSIPISDYVYGQGDMQAGAAVPAVQAGGTITFDNQDAPLENGIWHTITACRAPCDASTGVAFPLADGDVVFDSGQLGDAGPPTAGRTTWTTPTDLPVGTYTYFCRIHPFMRGAFRIEPAGG